jgi:uncharacterized membrane-anchored protein
MRIKFVVLVMFQVLLLIGMVVYRQYWVSTGERILLRTAPVDPRDIFRGDYVQLSYEISNIDLDQFPVKEGFNPNEKIYVILEKDADGTYKASSLRKLQPAGGKFIQGRVRNEMQASRWEVSVKDDLNNVHVFKPRWFYGFKNGDRALFCLDNLNNVISQFKEDANYKPQCPTGTSFKGTIETTKETKFKRLTVEYGIESYFVEEGKGKAIETARNARDVKVEVSLRKDGKGIITGLVMDGNAVK